MTTGKATAKGPGSERGAGLIELMIVVAILALLIIAAGESYRGWVRKYRVENDAKVLFADMMDARTRALQRSRVHFVQISGTRYRIYEDTDPGPDGNGTLEAASDNLVRQVTPWNALTAPGAATIRFNADGTSDADGLYVRVTAPSGTAPDYDCIGLRRTRLRLGRFDALGGTCVER